MRCIIKVGDVMDIGSKLKEARKGRATQKEIAELLNTTQQQVSKYENDIQEIPIRHLITIANYLKISIDELLEIKTKRRKKKMSKFNPKQEELLNQVLRDKSCDNSYNLNTKISDVTDNIIAAFADEFGIEYEIAAEMLIRIGGIKYYEIE